MKATATRASHGASRTIGGDLADWLIGAGVLGLVVAGLGFWGLPALLPQDHTAAVREMPTTPAADPLVDAPLVQLGLLEAPMPDGSGPAQTLQKHHLAAAEPASSAPPGAAVAEPLRADVATRVLATNTAVPVEARTAEGFVGVATPLLLPAPPITERVSVAELSERHGHRGEAEITIRQETTAELPRRLVDLLQEAAVAPPATGVTGPRTLTALATDLRTMVAEAAQQTSSTAARPVATAPSSVLPARPVESGPRSVSIPDQGQPIATSAVPRNSLTPASPTVIVTSPARDDPALLARLSRTMSSAGIDPKAPFTVVNDNGPPQELPLIGILASGAFINADATIRVLTRSETLERTTLSTLATKGASTEVEVVSGAAAERVVTLGELLGAEASGPDTLYYVRTVQPEDDQGIWGIVQFGLTNTFARGLRLGPAGAEDLVTIQIPADADELDGRRSSFLGRMIARKVDASLVYNFENSRMGRNPHLIQPGQELVIVAFSPAELNSIHDYFRPQNPVGTE
ncbi:MAG TPA: hypothetical protein DCY89_09560 [Gammaproteobacteria bacterium]|nr:hypothetical protein [Gammaproteobacteria bacterium]